jgi:hypothetical protein
VASALASGRRLAVRAGLTPSIPSGPMPCLCASQLENIITVTRTINTLAGADGVVTLDKDCTGSDAHGSNDCTIHWGDELGITFDLKLEEDLAEGASSLWPAYQGRPACVNARRGRARPHDLQLARQANDAPFTRVFSGIPY